MMHTVLDKTEKGREEIATRRYQLPSRVRSILLLVDGKQTGAELLARFAGIGVTEQVVQELLDGGYIQAQAGNASSSIPGASAGLSPLPAAPASQAVKAAPAAPAPVLLPGQTQYSALYTFYSETIKANLGLRAFGMQLKVEKCSSIDDFRALRTAYLEALLKARDTDAVLALRDRLDALLALPADDQVT